MRIVCPGCSAEYNVDDHRIPAEGMKATCPRCMNSWVVQQPGGGNVSIPVQPDSGAAGEPAAPPWQAEPAPTVVDDEPVIDAVDVAESSYSQVEGAGGGPGEIFVFGRAVPIPDLSRLPGGPKTLGILGVVLLLAIYGVIKVSAFGTDIRAKKATWSQVDFRALSLRDFRDARVTLKDPIPVSGTYQENFNAGFAAFNRDTFGGYTEAETALRKAAKLERKSALSIALLSETYTRLKEYNLKAHENADELTAKAWLRLDRSLRLGANLSEPNRAAAEFELVNLTPNYAKAGEFAQKAIQIKNGDAQNFITQGRIHLAQGETEKALKAFREAVSLNKNLASANYYLGYVLEKSAEYSKAEESFLQAIAQSSGHSRSYLALARMKLDRFNLVEDAMAFAKKVLEDHKEQASNMEKAQALHLLARGLEAKGDIQAAADAIAEARKLDAFASILVIFEASIRQRQESAFDADGYVDGIVVGEMQDADYFLYKATRLTAKGKVAEAIDTYRKVLAVDPLNARAHFELGRNFEMNFDFEKALDSYQKSLRADRGFGDAYVRLASLQIDKGRLEDALKLLEEANARNERIPSVHNLMGVIAMKSKNPDKAKEEFRKALEIDPRFAEARRSLARYYLATGDVAAADKEAKQARELDPGNKDTYVLMAEVSEAAGRFSDAMAAYDAILAKDPKNVKAYIGAGRAALGKKDYNKALTYLNRAVEIDDSNSVVFYLLGQAHFGLKKYDEAQQALLNAQRFDNKNYEIFLRLGEVLLDANKVSEAINYLKEVIALNPESSEGYGLLAAAHMRLGVRQEALTYYEKQVALTKDSRAKSDIYYDMGEALRQDAPEEANQHFQTALQLNKKNAQALYGIEQIHEENNNAAAATRSYLASIAADKNFAPPHRHLGYIYANQNRRPQAMKEFQTYLKLEPQAKDKEEIREQMSYLR